MHTRPSTLASVLSIATVLALVTVGTANAYPPDPPGEAVSRDHLATLTVTSEGSMVGYDRDKFPHWSAAPGENCSTREYVLERDGSDVSTGSDCYPTSGSWYSVYDQQWVADPGDVHIDHVVALAEAWRSGADDWVTARREDFANDLGSQQLIAVSASSNLTKSDEDPAEWRPANNGYHCMYARSWINVKYVWDLTINPPEKTALSRLLDKC